MAAEADVVVEVEEVEPGDDVGAAGGDGGMYLVEEGAAIRVAWGALDLVSRPGGDGGGGRLAGRVGVEPGEEIAVALTSGHLGFESFGVDAGELEEVLVERAGVFVFTLAAGEGGAAFVEHTREDDVAAEAHVGATGGSLGEVRGSEGHGTVSGRSI